MAELGTLGTMAELGALEAMADGLRGPRPRPPRPGPYSRNPTTPPKISMGKWGGIRSPPGLNRQDSTKHDRTALQGQTDRTGHPTGTRSPPGLARRLRLLLGMTRSQGPSQGPSATASTSATRGQAARMASMATTRGAACPRRVSMDKTRQGRLKCSCGHNKTDTRHSWPWHVDLIHGARDSGGQRAWINAVPVGLSQRQSGGLESAAGFRTAAGRRALSQRRAGGHWVRGDPVAWSPANGAPGGAATRELGKLPAGLGEPPPATDISRERRAWGLAASGLAPLAAIPPNSHADLQWAMAGMTSGDFHAAGQTYTNTGTK